MRRQDLAAAKRWHFNCQPIPGGLRRGFEDEYHQRLLKLMANTKFNSVIVGAGLVGWTAAYKRAKAGTPVVVLAELA